MIQNFGDIVSPLMKENMRKTHAKLVHDNNKLLSKRSLIISSSTKNGAPGTLRKKLDKNVLFEN